MRSARVGLDVVLHLRRGELLVERGDVGLRDPWVVAAEQAKDRSTHPSRLVRGHGPHVAFSRPEASVKTDDAGKAGLLRRRQEGDPPTEAEAENEHTRRARPLLQVRT